MPTQWYKNTCKECEEKERQAFQADRPFHKKVRRTVLYHSQKWNMDSKTWMKRFGLSYGFFEELFYSAYNSDWCQQCRQPYDEIEVMQLDLLFRDKDPTQSNWRIIHEWCNSGKGKKDASNYDYECLDRFSKNKQTEMALIEHKPINYEIKGIQYVFL